jgi:hypothetical protein
VKGRERGRRPAKRGARAEGRRTSAGPGRRRLRPILGALVVLGAIALAALAYRVVLRRPVRTIEPQEHLTPLAIRDSAGAALAALDWERAARWLEPLVAIEPRNSVYLRELGIAWHNLAWGGVPYGRERPASRTSLDRLAADLRALAALDSAAANAANAEDWVLSRERSGQTYETLGLPLDALQIYAEVRQRAPGYGPVFDRVRWVLSVLHDPLTQPRQGSAAVLDVRAQ